MVALPSMENREIFLKTLLAKEKVLILEVVVTLLIISNILYNPTFICS